MCGIAAIYGADQAGEAERMLGAAYDSTDLHDSQARTARVLEAMSAAFYSLDRDWRFTYVNAEAERILGRPREELVRYLTRNIAFDLDEELAAGLELFFRLAHRHGVIETLRPLKFIGTDVE